MKSGTFFSMVFAQVNLGLIKQVFKNTLIDLYELNFLKNVFTNLARIAFCYETWKDNWYSNSPIRWIYFYTESYSLSMWY